MRARFQTEHSPWIFQSSSKEYCKVPHPCPDTHIRITHVICMCVHTYEYTYTYPKKLSFSNLTERKGSKLPLTQVSCGGCFFGNHYSTKLSFKNSTQSFITVMIGITTFDLMHMEQFDNEIFKNASESETKLAKQSITQDYRYTHRLTD